MTPQIALAILSIVGGAALAVVGACVFLITKAVEFGRYVERIESRFAQSDLRDTRIEEALEEHMEWHAERAEVPAE